MRLNAAQDLQAQVRAIAERLSVDFAALLGDLFERGAPGAGRELSQRALERFWTSVLDSTGRYFERSNVRFPAGFFARLHRQWTEALRPLARTCFAPVLGELGRTFTEVVLYDDASVEEIAQRLRLKALSPSRGGPTPGPSARADTAQGEPFFPSRLPATRGAAGGAVGPPLAGRLGALYDVLRGFAVRLWFAADPLAPADPPLQLASSLKPGSLLLGGARLATPQMFERLSQLGAYGAFRAGRLSNLRVLLSREGGRRQGIRIEDGEVELTAGDSSCRLRRVAVVGKERVHAVVTNVLDPSLLPARLAIQLAVPQWRIERVFSDVAGVLDLKRFNASNPYAMEAQVHAAALLGAALRASQGWIAEASGLPPAALAPDFLFPQLARWMSSTVLAQAVSERPPEPGPAGRDPGKEEARGAKILTGDESVDAGGAPRGVIPAPRIGFGSRGRGSIEVEAAAGRRPLPQPASREEMMAIGRSEVEPAFLPFCEGYAKVGYRDGFLWKWVQRGLDLTALPSIDEPCRAANRTAKLLGVMLDVLLDDVADNLKDGDFLAALLKIPFHPHPEPPAGLGTDRTRYYHFTVEVWKEIDRLAKTFPRYGELAEVFEFDYLQLLNTMRYAFLVNRLPELLNSTEHDLYQPHNMHMMISGTLDLMCSSGFDRTELAQIRKALWRGQLMGRIGNMVSTWEREIKERDFTSGVFSAAIERGVVMACDLPEMPAEELREAIEKSGVIEFFLRQWQRLRDEVFAIAGGVRSVDLTCVGRGLEELIRNHLGSRGLK